MDREQSHEELRLRFLAIRQHRFKNETLKQLARDAFDNCDGNLLEKLDAMLSILELGNGKEEPLMTASLQTFHSFPDIDLNDPDTIRSLATTLTAPEYSAETFQNLQPFQMDDVESDEGIMGENIDEILLRAEQFPEELDIDELFKEYDFDEAGPPTQFYAEEASNSDPMDVNQPSTSRANTDYVLVESTDDHLVAADHEDESSENVARGSRAE